MFGWLKKRTEPKQHIEEGKQPETAMFLFDSIEPVRRAPQYGISTGPQGWGFHLWGSPDGEDFMYRHLLETLAELNPDARLTLPQWYDEEDLIEGSLIWRSQYVYVWYETVLTHIWLWSADEETIVSLRSAIVSLIQGSGSTSQLSRG